MKIKLHERYANNSVYEYIVVQHSAKVFYSEKLYSALSVRNFFVHNENWPEYTNVRVSVFSRDQWGLIDEFVSYGH